MSAEQCFCHLNGYKVKDADARELIENIEGDLLEFDERLYDIEGRITTIENDHVFGHKIYQHALKMVITANVAALEGDAVITINSLVYSNNSEEITTYSDIIKRAIIAGKVSSFQIKKSSTSFAYGLMTNVTITSSNLTCTYLKDASLLNTFGSNGYGSFNISIANFTAGLVITDTVTEV